MTILWTLRVCLRGIWYALHTGYLSDHIDAASRRLADVAALAPGPPAARKSRSGGICLPQDPPAAAAHDGRIGAERVRSRAAPAAIVSFFSANLTGGAQPRPMPRHGLPAGGLSNTSRPTWLGAAITSRRS